MNAPTPDDRRRQIEQVADARSVDPAEVEPLVPPCTCHTALGGHPVVCPVHPEAWRGYVEMSIPVNNTPAPDSPTGPVVVPARDPEVNLTGVASPDPLERMAARAHVDPRDAELEQLRRWKAEAMVVLAEWEGVWDALGQPGPLGSSKAANVLRLIGRSGLDQRTDRTRRIVTNEDG